MRTNPLRPIVLALVGALTAFVGGCAATTSISTVWQSPEPAPPPFTKIIVFVTNTSPAERRAGEDEMVRLIGGNRAVASYTLIPDDQIKDQQQVRAAMQQSGFDGAAVIRLVSSDKQTTYVPPSYGTSYYFLEQGYGSPAGTYAYYPERRGYTTTDTIVTAEVSVYAVKEERLIWAGSSRTANPDGIQDLIAQVVRGSIDELRARGHLK